MSGDFFTPRNGKPPITRGTYEPFGIRPWKPDDGEQKLQEHADRIATGGQRRKRRFERFIPEPLRQLGRRIFGRK